MARRRINLTEYAARRNEEAGLEFETPDGSVFFIPAPELWPDDFPVGGTPAEQTKAILGVEEYERFIAAGGSPKLLNSAYADAQEANPGES